MMMVERIGVVGIVLLCAVNAAVLDGKRLEAREHALQGGSIQGADAPRRGGGGKETRLRVNVEYGYEWQRQQHEDARIHAELHEWWEAHHDAMDAATGVTSLTTTTTARQSGSNDVLVAGSKSSFLVKYSSNVPADVRPAIEQAVSIWANTWPAVSTVVITLDVDWRRYSSAAVLAATGSPVFVEGDGTQLQADTMYSLAMARSITGENFGYDTMSDFFIVFNSLVLWNTDPNEAPSLSQHDLVTVMLHELCHGLFFDGTLVYEPFSNTVEFGEGLPGRFENFLASYTSSVSEETCEASSSSVIPVQALTSNSLFFKLNDRGNFSLYSPSSFQSGSSVYHFAEDNSVVLRDCQDAGIPDSACSDLMTPQLPSGYTQHDVGENTLRLMNAMIENAAGLGTGFCYVPGSSSGLNSTTKIILIVAGSLAGVVLLSVVAMLIYSHRKKREASKAENQFVNEAFADDSAGRYSF